MSTVSRDAPVDLVSNHRALIACLRELAEERAVAGLPSVTVLDGAVDDRLLSFDSSEGYKRVKPYIVVWGDAGTPLPAGERPVTWSHTSGAVWSPQLTVAAGHPEWVIGAVDVVRIALTRLRLPDGERLTEDDQGSRRVRKDPDVDGDTRWYVPIPLRVLLV